MDAYQEVAEAAIKRKQQIREWAAKQVDPTLAVTEIKEVVPSDPSPEEVQKVNMQGADETLGGPANEDATATGEAPVYEEVGDATAEDAEHYGDEANRVTLKAVQENDASTAKQGEEDATQEVEPDSEEEPVEDDSDEEAPAKSANKGEWVAYRIKTHGLTEDEANEKTKDELIALD